MGDSRGRSLRGATVSVIAAGGAVVIAAVLGGCDSRGDAASPLPTVASSAPTSPRPSATTAKQQVEATVRAYYDAMDLAIRTGDVEPFLAVTTKDCNCRALVTDVRNVFATGSTRDAKVDVVRIITLRPGVADTYDAEVVLRVAAYTEVDHAGVAQRRFKAKTSKRLLGLVPKQTNGFLVQSVVFEGNLE